MFFDVYLVYFNAILSVPFSLGSAEAHWVRWGLEWSFAGQLCLEYFYQKLLEIDNPSVTINNVGVPFLWHCSTVYKMVW